MNPFKRYPLPAALLSSLLILILVILFAPNKKPPYTHEPTPNTSPVKEWPGHYTQINQGQRTQTYLFEYDGRKYILVINTVGHDMVMVEHKSP